MVVYNNAAHLICFDSPESGQAVRLFPGANLNISESVWRELEKHMPDHIKAGRVSKADPQVNRSVKEDAPDEVKVKDKDLLAIIEETYDVAELEKIGKTGGVRVKRAVKAQIDKING